ncbi:MAG TPA: TonB family protein [Terriglobales bacterium]|nr:TonB family protein [Terriglobales bacterium]
MFLDRLQSGFLLFETQQGLVRVELSLRQRIYLLWTFRNFRQLSVPLLNPRQRTLVNALFRNHGGVVPHSGNSLHVIGVVENFVPPTPPIEVLIDASPGPKPAQEAAPKKERLEEVIAQPVEIAPQPNPVPSPSPRFTWSIFGWSKLRTSRLATTIGALCLCIISVGAWHRMQLVPASQAHNQTQLQRINAIAVPDSPRPAEPATIAEIPTVSAPPPASAQIPAAPEAAVMPASIAAEVPVQTSVPVSAPIPTPKREIRVPAASTPNLPLSGQNSGIQASRPPLRFAYPVYPDIRARGVVCLTAAVDSDGAVRSVRVVSGNRALAAAAVQAVRQWRYRPYLKDGQPVQTETNIVISFFSDDAISMSFPPSITAIH